MCGAIAATAPLLAAAGESAPDLQAARRRLLERLARGLVDSSITIPELLAGLRAFRVISHATCLEVGTLAEAERHLSAVTDVGLLPLCVTDRRAPHPAVTATVNQLEYGPADGRRVRAEDIARSLGLSRSRLSELLAECTGIGFRAWEFGSRARPALHDLALTTEHVSQIAWRWGWSSAEQFNHDFRRRLAMSPGTFRRLIDGS